MNTTGTRIIYRSAAVALIVLVMIHTSVGAQAQQAPWNNNEIQTIQSEILGEGREVWVHTPAGYGEGGERYPVIVILDAEQHFEHVAGFTDLLGTYFEMPRVLLVGLPNVNRGRDYFTRRIDSPSAEGNGAARLRAFMAEELLPFIDREYRTADFRVLIGHSLTGLFTVSTMLTAPELFNAHIAVSPSLQYVAQGLPSAWAGWNAAARSRPVSLYLATAVRDRSAIVGATDSFVTLMDGRTEDDLRLARETMQNENHFTVPVPAIYKGIRWLFDEWAAPVSSTLARIADGGPQPILEHYRNLSQRFGATFEPSVEHLMFFARRLASAGAIPAALSVAEQATLQDPASSRASEALAVMLEDAGDLAGARNAFEEAARRAAALGHMGAAALDTNVRRLEHRLRRRQQGLEARPFEPGVVETLADEYGLVFAPDGRRIYWVRREDRRGHESIVYADREDEEWSDWQPVFQTDHYDKEPFISPDGSKMFFASTRGGSGDEAFDLWVAEADGGGWGQPTRLPLTVNADGYDNYPSVAANGNLYFGSRRSGSQGIDIYVSRYVEGRYQEAENLGTVINSSSTEADPYIAPDESFLIFASTKPGGFGSGDLYVSVRDGDGWSSPINLGPSVNGDDWDFTPTLTPDGSVLVYSRGWGQILSIERPPQIPAQ